MAVGRAYRTYEDFAVDHAREACTGEPEPTPLERLLRQIHETVMACWMTLCVYIVCSTLIGLVA